MFFFCLTELEAESLRAVSSGSASEVELLLRPTTGHSTGHSSAKEGLENVIGIHVVSEGMSATVTPVQIFNIVALVVAGPLLRVGEDSVGLADLLEFLLLLSLFCLCRVGVTICKYKE